MTCKFCKEFDTQTYSPWIYGEFRIEAFNLKPDMIQMYVIHIFTSHEIVCDTFNIDDSKYLNGL